MCPYAGRTTGFLARAVIIRETQVKAMVWTKYGLPDVLQLQEVERPIPKDNEVLIKVRGATVTMGDCELRGLKGQALFVIAFRIYLGIARPTRVKILGQELAGDVEAVGKSV